MRFKLSRAAGFIDKYGLRRGLSLYFRLKRNRVSSIKVPGIKTVFSLRSGTSDTAIFDQVFLRGDYDIDIPFVPKTIIDAGANIGLFSLLMKNKYPASRVICIEPAQENYKLLKKNLSAYGDISFEQAGLWNSDTKLNVVDKYGMGHSALVVEEEPANGEVPALSMSTIMSRYGISQVDLLKIDIEGSEEVVFLKNYEQWLPRVKMIIIELHDWLEPGCSGPFFEAIEKTFRQYSYSVYNGNTVIVNNDIREIG